MAEIQDCVNILFDPVTRKGTGKAVIRMRSVRQAQLVASDIRELVFMIAKGPCPIEASVVRPSATAFTTLLFHSAVPEHMVTSLPAVSTATMLHCPHYLELHQVNEQSAHMVASAHMWPEGMMGNATPRLAHDILPPSMQLSLHCPLPWLLPLL